MPNYDVNVRRDWFLPLVGGAELNRIRLPSPIIFTSRPYPVDMEDSARDNVYLLDSFSLDFLDHQQTSHVAVESGSLRTAFQEYTNWAVDPMTMSKVSITGGQLRQPLQSYTLWPVETTTTTTTTVEVTGGSLKATLISYTRWPMEELKTGTLSITAGTLT